MSSQSARLLQPHVIAGTKIDGMAQTTHGPTEPATLRRPIEPPPTRGCGGTTYVTATRQPLSAMLSEPGRASAALPGLFGIDHGADCTAVRRVPIAIR